MKPISEWTMEELVKVIDEKLRDSRFCGEVFIELLHRERERCAAVCDLESAAWHGVDPGERAAQYCADRIRGLQ